MFTSRLSSRAEKFLDNADKELCNRISNEIDKLKIDPFPKGVKRVVGREEKTFRIRVGRYRILYVVFYETNEILIADIDKRAHAYD